MAVFQCDIPLRWGDLDAQGHVNNALVIDYLQESRVRFLLNGPNAHLLGNGIIVVGHQVNYVHPIVFDGQPIQARLKLGDVGGARFTIAYELHQRDQLVAYARTLLCLFDFQTNRPKRFLPPEREAFAAIAEPIEALPVVSEWQVGQNHHYHDFIVRWSDQDAYGHVNNMRYFDYIQEARIAMMMDATRTSLQHMVGPESNYVWFVVRQDVEYLRQMKHRSAPYRARTALARVGTTSATFAADITDPQDSTVIARATTVQVCADASGVPVPIPTELIDPIRPWVAVPRSQSGTRSA